MLYLLFEKPTSRAIKRKQNFLKQVNLYPEKYAGFFEMRKISAQKRSLTSNVK